MKSLCISLKNRTFISVSAWRQFSATFAVSLGFFVWGECLGWSSVVNPQLRRPDVGLGLDDDGASWVGSSVAIGGFFGGVMAGKLMNVLGRKRSLLFVTIVSGGGWTLLATANNLAAICVGRLIIGWAAACHGLIAPVYIGEISSSANRGFFGSFLSVINAIGITYVIVIGSVVKSWVFTTVACIGPVIIGFIALIFVPESPHFLMSHDKDEKAAMKALAWLNNNDSEEIEKAKKDIIEYLNCQHKNYHDVENQDDIRNQVIVADNLKKDPEKSGLELKQNDVVKNKSFRQSFKEGVASIDKISIRLIVILCFVMLFSRLSGISPLDFYMVEIFQKSSQTFDAFLSAIIVSVMEIFGMLISMLLIDRLNRKILLGVSGIGVGISLIVLGWSFGELLATSEAEPLNLSPIMKYLPLGAMLSFYLFFAIGLGPIPFVLLGELFPTHTKALASSISVSVLMLCDFTVAKLYFLVGSKIGVAGNFYILASCCFVGVIFVIFFVPETKNKSLAEIQTLAKDRRIFLSFESCQRKSTEENVSQTPTTEPTKNLGTYEP